MAAMSGAGRQTDALSHYQMWERRLREEEGVRPADALQKLAEEIRKAPVVLPSAAAGGVTSSDTGVVATPRPTELEFVPSNESSAKRYRLRVIAVSALLLQLLAIVAIATYQVVGDGLGTPAPNDLTRFAVLPFRYSDSLTTRLHEEALLQDALGAWEGLTVVDYWQVHGALAVEQNDRRLDADALPLPVAARAARQTGPAGCCWAMCHDWATHGAFGNAIRCATLAPAFVCATHLHASESMVGALKAHSMRFSGNCSLAAHACWLAARVRRLPTLPYPRLREARCHQTLGASRGRIGAFSGLARGCRVCAGRALVGANTDVESQGSI